MKLICIAFISLLMTTAFAAKVIEGDKAKEKFEALEKQKAEVVSQHKMDGSTGKVLRKDYTECGYQASNDLESYVCMEYAVTKVDKDLSVEKFCSDYKKESNVKENKGHSLKALEKALGVKGTLGIAAKNSEKSLSEAGFYNKFQYDEVKTESIPKGSIFVLDKAKDCPINEKYGHVAVKCDSDKMVWGDGQEKTISTFMKEHPKCVKAVMVNSKWEKSSTAKEVHSKTGSK